MLATAANNATPGRSRSSTSMLCSTRARSPASPAADATRAHQDDQVEDVRRQRCDDTRVLAAEPAHRIVDVVAVPRGQRDHVSRAAAQQG